MYILYTCIYTFGLYMYPSLLCVLLVVLCEVLAHPSDQRRDQLGEAGELPAEEGVAFLWL